MGTGKVKINTPTMAQKPPIALPVMDCGVWVPQPTEKQKYILSIFNVIKEEVGAIIVFRGRESPEFNYSAKKTGPFIFKVRTYIMGISISLFSLLCNMTGVFKKRSQKGI